MDSPSIISRIVNFIVTMCAVVVLVGTIGFGIAVIILRDLFSSLFAFIRRNWKTFTICGLVLFHIVLLVIVGALLPWYVILAFLPFMAALVAAIWFRKRVFRDFPRYVAERWQWKSFAICGGVLIAVVFFGIAFFTLSWEVFATQIAIPAFGSFGLVAVVIVTLRQLQIQSDQLKTQANNAQKQIAAEQFKNAIEHLASEKQTFVLGGIHALHNLAMNFEDDYSQQVFDVLCSFIRTETTKPEYQARVIAMLEKRDDADKAESPQYVTSLIVIQTIVNKLFPPKEWFPQKEGQFSSSQSRELN